MKSINYKDSISHLLKYFKDNLYSKPMIGAELEFHLFDILDEEFTLNQLYIAAKSRNIGIIKIIKEEGPNQYEAIFKESFDLVKLSEDIISFRQMALELSYIYKYNSSFVAKPSHADFSCGMHFHISLYDLDDYNLYTNDEKGKSEIMLYSIAGLCDLMEESMIFFAPHNHSFERIIHHNPFSPSKVSWGENNRSTSIRVPGSHRFSKRFEHRVPSSDCNPYEVIISILIGIYHGISNKPQLASKTYGNAYMDPSLKDLPKDYLSAKEIFEKKAILKSYLEKLL